MLFLGLSIYAWISIITVLTIFVLLLLDKLPADIAYAGGIGVILVTGVLSPKDALSGFSSETVVLVGIIYVILAGLSQSGVLQWIVKYLLGVPKSYSKAITRLMIPVGLLSSLLNNTTVVAMFLNVVKIWSKKLNISPSKLLIPLSYASGMGGICTLIGTAPNLIISGFYTQQTGIILGIFTPTLAGLFCFAVGILSMLAMRKLLPDRTSADDQFAQSHDYTVEMLVPSECGVVGKSVEEAKLLNVSGGHLIEIIRFDGEVVSPVATDEYLIGGDRLIFTGDINEILNLKKSHGLVNATEHVYNVNEVSKKRKLHTAIVPQTSGLIGQTISESGLEQKHNFTLVALSRQGERLTHSPRNIPLRAGDTLLLEGEKLRHDVFGHKLSFTETEDVVQTGTKTIISGIIMILMVVLPAFNVISLLSACFIAAFAILLFRCCSPEQAQRSVNWSVLVVFAGSITLGTALEQTGVATALSNVLLSICGDRPMLVLAAICFAGTFLTEFISNTAAAAIFAPIAYQSAVSMGVNPLTFSVALMIAVSSSFATPIGSPTHMLVYGPGGYRFGDFVKIGLLMNLIILAANLLIVPILFPL
ncbi:MAG: SLC13 family permease [Lepagella sp.]